MKVLSVLLLNCLFISGAFALPRAPLDPSHPGYIERGVKVKVLPIDFVRQGSVLFLPETEGEEQGSLPLMVFAHGQALKVKHYELFLKMLASKGIAVLYPQYDKGFFDRDWKRMGEDYDSIVEKVLKSYPQIDKGNILYSGHSKGGYIGLMALSHRSKRAFDWFPKTSIFYSPAGFERGSLYQIPTQHSMTLVWPKEDSVIKKDLIDEIFEDTSTPRKQKIIVNGYDELEAGHFFLLTSKLVFVGNDGIGPFHWYGVIPWTWGALRDPYFLYEEGALDSGEINNPHEREI